MKAHKFVAKNGVDEAKRVLNCAPACGQPIYYNITNSVYLFTGCSNFYFFNGDWRLLEDTTLGDFNIEAISLIELKQVIESFEIVDSYGGIMEAKTLCNCYSNACKSVGIKKSPRLLTLQKAIADYELVELLKRNKAIDKK